MTSTAQISEKDAYRFIQAAYVSNRIDLQIDLTHLVREGSPVYSPKNVLFPALFLMLVCMASLLAALGGYLSLINCLGVMVVALLIQLFLVRFWVIYRVRQRTMKALLTHLSYWKALWRFGGIAITLTQSSSVRCTAPKGDWRLFVTSHLSDLGQRSNVTEDNENAANESEVVNVSGT